MTQVIEPPLMAAPAIAPIVPANASQPADLSGIAHLLERCLCTFSSELRLSQIEQDNKRDDRLGRGVASFLTQRCTVLPVLCGQKETPVACAPAMVRVHRGIGRGVSGATSHTVPRPSPAAISSWLC
jgi:hypothetical protein